MLGDQLIRSAGIAAFELAKNAYDADAGSFSLTINDPTNTKAAEIVAEDDGVGMTWQTVTGPWLEPGSRVREDDRIAGRRTRRYKRLPMGGKGEGGALAPSHRAPPRPTGGRLKMIRMMLSFLAQVVKTVGTTALTPVLEKNVVKTLAMDSKLVVSMSRVIVMAFAVVMLKEFWRSGINGWPDAALGIATVLALPIMSSLEHANPDEVLALTRVILAKFDDHRAD